MPEEKKSTMLPIRRTFRDDTVTLFANDLVVQHHSNSFVLSFFEIWNPAILGETEEEREKALKAIEVVDARCVARLAVSPDVMRKIVDAMDRNLKKFDEKLEKKKNE